MNSISERLKDLADLMHESSWMGPRIKQVKEIHYARRQGALNFYPSMLPDLWKTRCPYSNIHCKNAWVTGFFSCACWFLIHAYINKVDLSQIDRFYAKNPDYKLVPRRV